MLAKIKTLSTNVIRVSSLELWLFYRILEMLGVRYRSQILISWQVVELEILGTV